jgi:hypothetical protein
MNKKEQHRGIGLPSGTESIMAAGGKDIHQITYHPRFRELPDPPITRTVRLPEIVSVRYLAEIIAETTKKPFGETVSHMWKYIGVSLTRSTFFADAERVLRKYGIGAELES